MKTTFYIFVLLCIPLTNLGQVSFNVDFLDNWIDETMPASTFDIRFNEVYGFAIEESEYAVLGSGKGTHIFSVEKNEITEIAFIEGALANEFVFHRDYHVYQNYLYAVCNEGFSDLQIIDLQYLPDSVSIVYESKQLFSRAHNIFIDTSAAILYACDPVGGTDPNLNGSGIELFDLSDPTNPQTISVSFPALPESVHDIYVRNGIAYLNCYYEGLQIFDFTNSENPKKIGHLVSYTDEGTNHSGWLTEDGNYYFLIDETSGSRIKVVDVSNLPTIRVIEVFGTNHANGSIPHNIMIKDNYAYVSYYNEGLRIYDISDVRNVTEAGFYDTYPENHKFKMNGAWGIYTFLPSGKLLVSDRQYGLFLLQSKIDISLQGVKDFYVYPNPTQSFITINTALNQYPNTPINLQISDSKGKILLQLSTEEQSVFTFDVSDWAEGTYYVSLYNEDLLIYDFKKFIKTR